ncbi:hypothetical protein [Thiocapsa sp. N5-Cardenillas]|uniref:hypothetical protein n=1 Tax=Thiocapsa sp. N5-Cardenillas TaxID=3137397 RepID=UPI0035AF3719
MNAPKRESLYDALRAAGVPIASHESDLYFEDSPQAREILARFPGQEKMAKGFRNQETSTAWLDVPFAFLPWWEKRQR